MPGNVFFFFFLGSWPQILCSGRLRLGQSCISNNDHSLRSRTLRFLMIAVALAAMAVNTELSGIGFHLNF